MTTFLRETRSELRKVVWPSQEASIHNAAIVSVVLLSVVVVLVALDLAFGWSTARLFAN